MQQRICLPLKGEETFSSCYDVKGRTDTNNFISKVINE